MVVSSSPKKNSTQSKENQDRDLYPSQVNAIYPSVLATENRPPPPNFQEL